MNQTESNLYPLIWQTRRLFQRLRITSDELLDETGISASQRAILEFLYQHPPQTVPHIAQERNVSRQHIQTIVNTLHELGYVEALVNPAHKRSPLVGLTTQGNKLFKAIQRKELQLLTQMEKLFPQNDLRSALKTLESIDAYLASGDWRNIK